MARMKEVGPKRLSEAEVAEVTGGRWWGFDPPPMTNREYIEEVMGVPWPLPDPDAPKLNKK